MNLNTFVHQAVIRRPMVDNTPMVAVAQTPELLEEALLMYAQQGMANAPSGPNTQEFFRLLQEGRAQQAVEFYFDHSPYGETIEYVATPVFDGETLHLDD